MRNVFLAGAAMMIAGVGSAGAADVLPPPIVEAPYYEPQAAQPVAAAGGWYLRGDVGYSWNKIKGVDFFQGPNVAGYTSFTSTDLRGSYSVGGGVGYQINDKLRTDVTLDYFGKSKFRGATVGTCGAGPLVPCTSTDLTSMTAYSLLANAYVDFYKRGRFTLYGGAGIGGTHVKWNDLKNEACPDNGIPCDGVETHDGRGSWRFTYALMAGASFDVTCKLKADVGYRYRHVNGGKMFGFPTGAGTQGYDRGFDSHEARAGLRYSLSGDDCAQEQVYIEPAPIMPAVYK